MIVCCKGEVLSCFDDDEKSNLVKFDKTQLMSNFMAFFDLEPQKFKCCIFFYLRGK